MQIDVPSPAIEAPPQSSEKNILLEEKHLKFQNKMKKDTFEQLKTRRFISTPAYDPTILRSIGMDTEFEIIF